MKLLTAVEMRELDRRAMEEIGIPGAVLMESAGRGAAELLAERYADLFPGPVLILAGKGNNGGDGFVVARWLLNRGWQVQTIVLAAPAAIGGDAGLNLDILQRCGATVTAVTTDEQLSSALAAHSGVILVDALLGTGLANPVSGRYAVAIDWLGAQRAPLVAVDIPSGVDATTGAILGRAARADLTVTFAAAKVGHAVSPGFSCCGELKIVDIGIPATLSASTGDNHWLIEAAEAAPLLPLRPVNGHKGTFGHLLVLAGSPGKTGAATLTAAAAVRGGAGLVTLACPATVHDIMEIKLTEAMTVALPDHDGHLGEDSLVPLNALLDNKSALALGPGLGMSGQTVRLVRRIVGESSLPLVVDADGLNALAGHCHVLKERPRARTILTPHPGEMARLLGCGVAAVEAERIKCAREFAMEYGIVLLLKGARTIIALPDGRIRINSSGNPLLATGGSGDVLTGLIGALLAQGLTVDDAAVLGSYLHGAAADHWAARHGDAGMTATELLNELPAVWRELRLIRSQTC